MKNSEGFTLIELIMVMVLLSIMVTVASPLVDKPYQVYQLSRSLHHANKQALITMHWLQRDLKRPISNLQLSQGERELKIKRENDIVHYYLANDPKNSDQTLLYRDRYNESTGRRYEQSVIAQDITELLFDFGSPFLSINFEVDDDSGKPIHYWRQLTVTSVAVQHG